MKDRGDNMTDKKSVSIARGESVIPKLGTGCLMLVGALILVISAAFYFEPDHVDFFGFLFYGLVGIGFIVSGAFWFRYISTLEEARRSKFEEKVVLECVEEMGGMATVAQIALRTPLSSTEVEQVLDRFCKHGIAEPDILEDGAICYRFKGLSR